MSFGDEVVKSKGEQFDNAKAFVAALNATNSRPMDIAVQTELRFWVDVWLESNSDATKLKASLSPERRKQLFGIGRCEFLPVGSRFGTRPLPLSGAGGRPGAPERALVIFRSLLLSSHADQVCAPCTTCGKYYVRRTKHRAKYCSRKCGAYSAAVKANEKKNEDNHAELLQLAREAIDAYVASSPNEQTWESSVLAYLKQHGHERKEKSLHRWVNDEKRAPGEGLKLPPEIQSSQRKSTKKGSVHSA
jgi:hypothetical protein